MKRAWPMVALGDVLKHTPRPLKPTIDVAYREIGIRSHGRGIFHKPPTTVGDIGTKKVFAIEPGDFIVNIVFAWEGAVAVAGADEAGMIASHRFPTFRADPTRLDVGLLPLFFRTAEGRDLLNRVSPGGAGRNRTLNRGAFLAEQISLPPIDEQRRLVAHIGTVSSHIAKALGPRQEARGDTDRLATLAEANLWSSLEGVALAPLESVTTFLSRGRQSEQGESDHHLIKTQHVQQGRYVQTSLRLAPHAARKVDERAIAQEGDILIACSAAGCLGRVARFSGADRASTDTHVAIARAQPATVEPAYLYAYLLGPRGQHELRSRERGDWTREKVGFRLTELNLKDLRRVPIPVPPLSVQRDIVGQVSALREELDAVRALQDESAREIDALQTSIVRSAFRPAD